MAIRFRVSRKGLKVASVLCVVALVVVGFNTLLMALLTNLFVVLGKPFGKNPVYLFFVISSAVSASFAIALSIGSLVVP